MKIIAVIGKTSTGKDTVVNFIKEAYGIHPIVSYTTRKKRENEVDGREHWFVSESDMNLMFADKSKLLAYATFPKTNIRYCTTSDRMSDDDIVTYIINPKALEEMKKNRPDVEVISIFLYLPEKVIRKRAGNRGDNDIDIEKRLDSEREEFDYYFENHEYDAKINTDQKLVSVYAEVHDILLKKGIKTRSERMSERMNFKKLEAPDFD